MGLIERADRYAALAHNGQMRRYTPEQYIEHPRRVALMVKGLGAPDHVVAAALLHDVVEDCGVSLAAITEEFGPDTAKLVDECTKRPTVGNRAVRKAADLAWYATASYWGKTIKLADGVDNIGSIAAHDSKFAPTYLKEKQAVFEALTDAHPKMVEQAQDTLAYWMQTYGLM